MHIIVRVFSLFFQAEDGIRDLVRSRGLGDVYKRQAEEGGREEAGRRSLRRSGAGARHRRNAHDALHLLSLIHI